MKKAILSLLTVTMLLSNILVVSAKPVHPNTDKDRVVTITNPNDGYRLFTTDPY